MADKNTVFQQKLTLNIRGRLVDLRQPKVMGIINLTPDSFYDGGRNKDIAAVVEKCTDMVGQGAEFLDLGAYSSRPGAEHITEQEELDRLLPYLRKIRKALPYVFISVDTFRSEVARIAIGEGADIINDISGGTMDAAMFDRVAELKVPYILMHMKGTPQTMARETDYEHLLTEVIHTLAARAKVLVERGVHDLIIDPGFGFAKTREQSFELLKKLEMIKMVGHPILAGLSRKSMIYKTLNTTPENALHGTTAANAVALMNGANILRVHDVHAAVDTIRIISQIYE